MTTPDEAEQILTEMTEKWGYLDEEMMDNIGRFDETIRRRLDKQWLKMETALSHSINVLAKNIYGSGARFVFELLQNAEDNRFRKAADQKALPFISFKIHPNHIVVECNEDGFNGEDLKAICSLGESSKSARHEYIGAKGIGFKSVFIAAWRVHIQSGNLSFEFRHRRSDPGLGMVRPIRVPHTEPIPSPLTRTTLYLHDQGDEQELEHLRTIISMQFDDLQETCLLFLRKLREISVAFYDEEGKLQRSKQFRKHDIDDHRVSLDTITIIDGEETINRQVYHITKDLATGIALSDNRDPPENEQDRRDSTTAEVVLAFPLTDEYKPHYSNQRQELFAFLPLRSSDYKFHIHSDFDTNANRQDIITTSRRNLNIRDFIADVFYKAVLQFCEHPTLCYHWPLFLPPIHSRSDSFWSGLDAKIKSLMREQPVVKSRNWSALRHLHDVVMLTPDARDEDGKPLFDDHIKDPFISTKYNPDAVNALKAYGLKNLKSGMFIDLIQMDLKKSQCKLKGQRMTEKWHSSVARLLLKILETKSSSRLRIPQLDILPLRDNTWTSIKIAPVYFPKTGDIDIPGMLDLRVLSPSAIQNPDRRALYEKLGATEATTSQARESIIVSFDTAETLSASKVLELLRYLYLTHEESVHASGDYDDVWLITSDLDIHYPDISVIYLPGTDHLYSPESLLAAQDTAPGFDAHYLHQSILKGPQDLPQSSSPLQISWKKWMVDYIGVHERLSLISPVRDGLSDPFLYVYNHRPDRFLGLFEYLWVFEGSRVLKVPGLISRIRKFSAKKLCTVAFSPNLEDTWLPVPHLKSSVERYMEHPEQFPFLNIEGYDGDQWPSMKWNFLTKHFSVGKDEDIEFLLEILTCIKREYFKASGILAPHEENPLWTTSSSCVWAAPPGMMTAHSLKSLYRRQGLSDEDMSSIENLFSRTLGIQDATFDNLLVELGRLRETGYEGDDRILDLYMYMDTEFSVVPSGTRVKFESSPLIFSRLSGKPCWYKISDCLWSSITKIRGKVTLDESYEELKGFFVVKLGVKSLTMQMVYNELKESPQSSVKDIKDAILSLNGFLQGKEGEQGHWDPKPIKQAKIFPVRYPNGSISLSSVAVDFAIADREILQYKFEDKIAILDFNLEDIHQLKPFFTWLKIETRYLSRCVREITSISGDMGSPITSRKRDLRRKAYYIARVAATFRSPRFQNDGLHLYKQLRNMAVKEVDEITSTLQINQSGHSHTATLSTAREHIDDSAEDAVIIFVPRDRRAQEICFGSVLPRKFASWLMRHPISGKVDADLVTALTSVFASDRCGVDEILDDQGIIQVEFEDDEDEEHDDEEHGGYEQEEATAARSQETDDVPSELNLTPTHSSETGRSSPYTASLGFEPQASLVETTVDTVAQRSNMSHQTRPSPVLHSPQPDSPPTPQAHASLSSGHTFSAAQAAEDARYLSILENVIRAARRANFPSGGAFDLHDLRDALPGGYSDAYEGFDGLDVLNRFRSTSQQERDKKIGAAGELYVFELLSKLELPGWSRGNWQSTIRIYAAIHPEYSSITHWSCRETADLVYTDCEGQLTNTLVEASILTGDEWTGKRPKYYIEVKTTSGPCKTPFYMSGNQYRLMERIHYKADRTEVYMVFRVYFLLDSSRINYCVYLDPKKLKDAGQLLFSATTWSITPGANE
ncbi:hypothetical protein HG530_009279 [Fusarium avenaceum]|nr:hypothetical protein HG530_009279 [Fusarium avenaceum]